MLCPWSNVLDGSDHRLDQKMQTTSHRMNDSNNTAQDGANNIAHDYINNTAQHGPDHNIEITLHTI